MTRRSLFTKLAGFLAILPFVGKGEAQTPRFYRPRYRGRPVIVAPILHRWSHDGWQAHTTYSDGYLYKCHGRLVELEPHYNACMHPDWRWRVGRRMRRYGHGTWLGARTQDRNFTFQTETYSEACAWVMADPYN